MVVASMAPKRTIVGINFRYHAGSFFGTTVGFASLGLSRTTFFVIGRVRIVSSVNDEGCYNVRVEIDKETN